MKECKCNNQRPCYRSSNSTGICPDDIIMLEPQAPKHRVMREDGFKFPSLFKIIVLIWLIILTFTTFAQSQSKVLDVLIRCRVSHPRMVMRQAILESGHFSSDICKENHNIFGMKLAKQRPTTATGTNRNHATYNHWIDSIIDYKIWQDKYFKGGDYLLFLKKVGYATDKNYIYKLKKIKL